MRTSSRLNVVSYCTTVKKDIDFGNISDLESTPSHSSMGLSESQQAVSSAPKSRERHHVQNLCKLGFVRQSMVTTKKCASTS